METETPLAIAGNPIDSAKRPANTARMREQGPEKLGSRRLGAVIGVTVVAVAILVGPLAVGGIWDPIEVRVAALASRIAASLFHAQLTAFGSDVAHTMPTLGELGRGELPFTSIAAGFRLFGVHDWAGRLPLALWLVAALVSQVVWVTRFIGERAAAWSALVFCTMPLVFFQARFMLGDATTIGTSTLSFVFFSLACLAAPKHRPLAVGWRCVYFVLGLVAAGFGVLTRGLAIGVAVPALAVSVAHFVAELPEGRSGKPRWQIELLLVRLTALLGLGSAAMAISIAVRPASQRGLWLVLQGMAIASPGRMPTFESVVTQLGHGLFPWSLVLPFGLVAVFSRLRRMGAAQSGRAAIGALILFVFLNGAMQTWLTSMGATLPFPGLAALAVIVGVWLEAPDADGQQSRNVLLGVLALAAILLADFENLPDKLLAATTAVDAKIPASFKAENLSWLRASAGIVGASFVISSMRVYDAERAPRSIPELILGCTHYLREVLGGQLFFFALLLETSLMTGAALVTATRLGAPFQRIRYLSSMQRDVLTWAWALLPALVLAGLVALVLYELLAGFFEPGFGLSRWATVSGFRGRAAQAIMAKCPRALEFRISRVAVLRLGLLLAAMLLSLGWASRLSQHLSPRRALNRYHALAQSGEPLGLLGVRPQITHYYSRQRPELLLDAEEAADWLLNGKTTARRWLLVKGDQFARFNAAFRERCQCSQNAPVIDGRSSELFLISNQLVSTQRDENPLRSIALDHAPSPRQKISGNFGDQVEAIGWDLVTEDGRPVAELRAGRKYELQLYYRVMARPTTDWETFVHIDGYGRRYNGDHETTQGAYPMSNWRPGDYIVDRETIALDPSFSEGNYDLYFGFFKGSRRLEVKSGNHDDNRLLAGTIRVM